MGYSSQIQLNVLIIKVISLFLARSFVLWLMLFRVFKCGTNTTSQSDLQFAMRKRRIKRMDPGLFSKSLLVFYVEIQLKFQYITIFGLPII